MDLDIPDLNDTKVDEKKRNMIGVDYFVTVVPTTLLFLSYLMILFILSSKRSKFKSSFFTLTIAQSVVDIVLFLFIQIWQRGRKYGYLEPFFIQHRTGFIPYFSFATTYYLKVVQYLGMFIMTFNRFSTFCIRGSHEIVWTTKGIVAVTVLQWTLPLLMLLFFAFSNYEISFKLINGQWRSQTNPFYVLWFGIVECIIGLIVLLVCFFLNGFSLYQVRRQHSFNDDKAKRSYNLEIRFLMSSFAVFLFLSLDILFNVTQTTFTILHMDSAIKSMGTAWYMLAEFCCLSRPVSLLVTSKVLRTEFWDLLSVPWQKARMVKALNASRVETSPTLF
uniref:Serpentine receptor class gamma n=1 Tax=Steinernema glaseri TaxID=37863 RepID=A0A1I8ASW3_9BILA